MPRAVPAAAWLLCALVLAGACALAVALRRRFPYLATGWFWYLGMLVPVIGLVKIGGQSMADRYTYLPLVGVFLIVSWGMRHALGGARRSGTLFAGLAVLTCLALAAASRPQLAS